jgi:activator of HSP90 ATPase
MSATVPAPRKKIFEGWLNSKIHTAFTGSPATASARVGGKFSAWDGYISGTNTELTPHRRIVQAWRTTEFPPGAPASTLTLELADAKGGTRITLIHTNIPKGQATAYRQGWKDFYFIPMKAYFKNLQNG